MESDLQSFFTFVIFVQIIIGNLSNEFILLINLIDWFNRRKLSSVDQIITILAVSRIGLIWGILVSWSQFINSFPKLKQLIITVYIWILSNHFSLWLATILSIFYLLKIARFSRPIFLYLKWRVKKVILTILFGMLVFLFFNVMQINTHIKNWKHNHEKNTTWNFTVTDFVTLSRHIILSITMFSLTPFILALISFLLLIVSLWKHLRKMQLNCKGSRDPRTNDHINALKIMVSFLLLYTSYFLSRIVSWISHIYQVKLVDLLSMAIGLFYPSTHSLVLILGNSKLSKASFFVLRKLKCRIKNETTA
ncbi:taste receptor type 2 member 13-like [Cavia porcellus]|uniref:taste receptor type 2 member 13-like n=1 Tax=Cavia porcellus TaxID=10141 RepID=UPI0003509CD5|nr:taste receptor type 2 member 13-like [Cavia porcellus]